MKTKGMYVLTGLVALAFSCVTLTNQAVAQSPDMADVAVYGLIAVGKGCPKGSLTKIVTNSRPGSTTADYFQVTYDKFTVEHGPGIPRWESRKTCNIVYNVDYPRGFKFSFDNLSFNGYAEVQAGVRAEFDARIRTPLEDKDVKFKGVIQGYYEGGYEDVVRGRLEKFNSGCGGSAMIKVENMIRMRGKSPDKSIITIDTVSGAMTQAFKVQWEKCTAEEMAALEAQEAREGRRPTYINP